MPKIITTISFKRLKEFLLKKCENEISITSNIDEGDYSIEIELNANYNSKPIFLSTNLYLKKGNKIRLDLDSNKITITPNENINMFIENLYVALYTTLIEKHDMKPMEY